MVTRYSCICWIAAVWFTLAQSSYVNPSQPQQRQWQMRGYYRPPSARMITPEEAKIQQHHHPQHRGHADPASAGAGAGGDVDAPRLQQPVQPSNDGKHGSGDRMQEQTMESYLKSLGVKDPSVAALLSDTTVEDVANSVEAAVQSAHSHHRQRQEQQPQPLREDNPQTKAYNVPNPPSVHAGSVIRPREAVDYGVTSTDRGRAQDRDGSDPTRMRQEHSQLHADMHVDMKDDVQRDEDEGNDRDDEFGATVHLSNSDPGSGDADDDDPTYHVQAPDDPIGDTSSPQMREPISEWLDKFWDDRRAFKLSSTQMEPQSHPTHNQHLTPVAPQQHQQYIHPNQHHLPGQRGSQINVYGQLHIHVGNQHSR